MLRVPTAPADDNPDLIVAAVVGDGEAETGPLAGSWTGIDFLNPARDGAVLPILHLNGYKIGGPTVLGRMGDDDIVSLLHGHGWEPHVVAGDDPVVMHPRFAQVLDDCHERIRAIQATNTSSTKAASRGSASLVSSAVFPNRQPPTNPVPWWYASAA